MKLPRLLAVSLALVCLSFLVSVIGFTEERSHLYSTQVDPHLWPPPDDQGGGIKEVVPAKYQVRYQRWKEEFLSTETGREQWTRYEHDPGFTLTIQVTGGNDQGAGTSKYKWDEKGRLVAATITLVPRINKGFPSPVYYPVMCSLRTHEFAPDMDMVLAATKIAHEFGHLIRMETTDAHLYQLQTQLIPQYNKIFLSNGRNPGDPRLMDMARRMGGTPIEIWRDREYWDEANAMLYLRDRFS